MKKLLSFFVFVIFLAIFFYPETTISMLTGSPGGKTGSPMDNSDCTSCHAVLGTVVTTTNITSDIPATGYVPGNIYTITANFPAFDARGFEITCEENVNNTKIGTFFITNPIETQLVNNGTAVTHTTAGNTSNSWSFDWEAPAAGTGDVTFYGAFMEGGYPLSAPLGDYLTLSTLSISEVSNACNLNGASVYIDHSSAPWMMNATVNGMSQYSYLWSNGANSNQTSFYTQWCVTITDVVTGCDTIICQDCIADSTAMCGCIMIYMPVCGCDGVMYANSCIADCADVPWTPAIPSGMPGGFLPCTLACEVEIDGDSIICNWGDSILLQASPTASSTPFVSYQWSTGDTGNILSTTANFPGIYSVTATDSSGCSSTASFSVGLEDIFIWPFTGSLICLGDTVGLFIDSMMTDIIWVPTGDTTHIIYDTPLTSTVYIAEGTDWNGCDRRGEIVVIVDSCNTSTCFVDINNGTVDIEICDGDTAVLEATSGFDSYVWTLASTGALLGSTNIINVTNPGVYVVVATDIINNCVDMDSIEVVVYPATPLNLITVPNPPVVCLGDSLVIEVNSGFIGYWWNTGNPNDTNQDRVVVYPTQDFTYVVEALDMNGCESQEEIEVFVDTCATSIFQINNNQIEIYPNPAQNEFFINLNSSNFYNIEIIDVIGKVLISKENVNNLISIKTSEFSEGTYFIQIQNSQEIQIYKIIIDK